MWSDFFTFWPKANTIHVPTIESYFNSRDVINSVNAVDYFTFRFQVVELLSGRRNNKQLFLRTDITEESLIIFFSLKAL